jgi:cell division protein FtsL
MRMDPEYAIKQDIRNNAVVRQIDLQQKRDFLRTIGLGGLLVGTVLFAVVPPLRLVSNGYEVERLRQELVREEARQRTLRLQLEERLSPAVIERRARQELGMELPTADDTVVIERITTAVPSSAVVARAEGGR